MTQSAAVIWFVPRTISQSSASLELVPAKDGGDFRLEKIWPDDKVSADTVAAAANEVTLLSLDSVLRLCFFWPTASETILGLAKPIAEKPTVEDRIELIERQLEAIREWAAECQE